MSNCSFCRGPLTGSGYDGRRSPGRPISAYCCFGCLSIGEGRAYGANSPQAAGNWKVSGLGVRLGIGILVAGQSMIFGLALNLHDDVPVDVRWYVQSLIAAATLLVVGLLGGPLVRTAWRELRRGRLTLEALFLLTAFGAMAASLQAHITGRGKIYFEVVSVLLAVYTLGKTIGSRSRSAALASSLAWADRLNVCRLIDERGRTRTASVAEVLPGDAIEVSPGESITVDGTIREGIGFVSEAAISGEPFATVRRPGDRVLAGAASCDATFRIEATAKGSERQVDRLLAVVERAQQTPASIQGQANRIGRIFFPLTVLTAASTFGYWALLTSAGWEAGLFNAMSVLLVACPCALGLAAPIAIWSALGRLAERGLIVRTGSAIERLAEVDRAMLDKTGTLTDDSYALLDIATRATGSERTRLLGWLSIVQERSKHPVARPFARLPRSFARGREPHIVGLRVIPGCGVTAELQEFDGTQRAIQIGTTQWLISNGDYPAELPRESARGEPDAAESIPVDLAAELRAEGHRIVVRIDGEVAAIAVLAERLRDSALEAIAGFQKLGVKVEVLTGDRVERAQALNLPSASGGLMPDDKRAAIEAAKSLGAKPLFVGDGINDAAALSAAHVGIALSCGTDLAVGAAAMTLYHDDLRVLPWAIELSRETVRTVRRCLARAALYNLVGMSLAACGILHPIVAALLMVASSSMLIFSATRIGSSLSHCSTAVESGSANYREPSSSIDGSLELAANSSLRLRAFGHATAIAMQGIAWLFLLEAARDLATAAFIVAIFATSGLVLGYTWLRWTKMPHAIDMCFGMLSFGNLGMLLGWWADSGFEPLADGACPICAAIVRQSILQPWMWLGMLFGANVAMMWFARCSLLPSRSHVLAMYSGGNLGMIGGMLAGGKCAEWIPMDSVPLASVASFVGMAAGMLAGMLLGTRLVEMSIDAAWAFPSFAIWMRGRFRGTVG